MLTVRRVPTDEGDEATIYGNCVSVLPDGTGLFVAGDPSHIRISGMRVVNASPNVSNAGSEADNSSHIIIENNSTYNTVSSSIGVSNGDNTVIRGHEAPFSSGHVHLPVVLKRSPGLGFL